MTKYDFKNGRLVTATQAEAKGSPVLANARRAITCPYTIEEANEAAGISRTKISESTVNMATTVQSTDYTNHYGRDANVDGEDLIDKISQAFSALNIPIGLSNKLIGLKGYAIHFKIDDSGSMGSISNNGLSRWENVRRRLLQLIHLLQFVPTKPITISFLDRRHVITLDRHNKTPQQFVEHATKEINNAFRMDPDGGTPIYKSVKHMLHHGKGKKADFLFTDGAPSDDDFEDKEDEIEAVKNLLLNRENPQDNPFTFLCCSDNPNDTLWMHEIEEIACRPGAPGYVAAVQNFRAEQLEVLNDQGPEFPYSEAMWMLCNLTAAMNPNDLDELDEHAPLTKPILDNMIGRVTTLTEYESYFNQHPNANWIFGEDYSLFLTEPVTSNIPSVAFFENRLAQELNSDMNKKDDWSEPRALARTEAALLQEFKRERPHSLVKARQDFWYKYCVQMEQHQAQHISRAGCQAQQDVWGDFVVAAHIGPQWREFIEAFQQWRDPANAPSSDYLPTPDDQPPQYAVIDPHPMVIEYAPPAYHVSYIQPVYYGSGYTTQVTPSVYTQAPVPVQALAPVPAYVPAPAPVEVSPLVASYANVASQQPVPSANISSNYNPGMWPPASAQQVQQQQQPTRAPNVTREDEVVSAAKPAGSGCCSIQ